MSAPCSTVQNQHEAEFVVDLTRFAQKASAEQAVILAAELRVSTSVIGSRLWWELTQLIEKGVFDSENRPTTCVVSGIFTYSNPYFSRAKGLFLPQSPEDVRSHFQYVIDRAVSAVECPFQLSFNLKERPVRAGTYAGLPEC